MKVIINNVYDKQRFKWFIHLKYQYSLEPNEKLAKHINNGNPYTITNLTEVEVRYLQDLCELKIIPTTMPLKEKRITYITPQYGDESKQETLDLFHVTFTKIIHFDEMLNERQIQALLKDNHVKSINIEK
jgi:hypothetical protein